MDLDDIYRLLRGAHVQAQGIVDTLRDPMLVLDSELTILSANPAFYRVFDLSRDATVGAPFYELGEGQWNIKELRHLIEKVIPKSASVFDYEVEARFPDLGLRTMLLSAQRLVHPDSGRRLLMLTIVDATERRRKERNQDILLGEVHHRMKNLLSVTQALARQTRVKDRTAEQFREDFLHRFVALGRALDISSRHEAADLAELMTTVLQPFRGFGPNGKSKINLDGVTSAKLSPRQTMALGMILQELATNAIKHGALSVAQGQVKITSTVETHAQGDDMIRLDWAESDGPQVVAPSVKGFGTKLIEASVKHELSGSAEPTYASDGFFFTVVFPRN